MKLYNGNILTFPKSGTKFLTEVFGTYEKLTYDDLFIDEKYRDKPLYIVIRNPKNNLIKAINVGLNYENKPTLQETMENILLNKDVHFNTNRFQMLTLYNKLNKNITFVELCDLSNFLEKVVKIPPSKLQVNQNIHKTVLFYTENEIINEKPYLWNLFERILMYELNLYEEFLGGKNIYTPPRNLI